MESVYIETSVVSYLVARPSREPVTAWRQHLTSNWCNDLPQSSFVCDQSLLIRGQHLLIADQLSFVRDQLCFVDDEVSLIRDGVSLIRHQLRLVGD